MILKIRKLHIDDSDSIFSFLKNSIINFQYLKFSKSTTIVIRLSSLFLILLSEIGYTQNIDSLKFALKNEKVDTTICNILSELAESAEEDEWPIFNEQLLIRAEKGVKESKSKNTSQFYKRHWALALNNKGIIEDNLGNVLKAIEYYLHCLQICEEINEKEGIANSINNLGYLYSKQGDIPKALEYYHKSLKIHETLKDKLGIANLYNNIGAIYDDQDDFIKALEYFNKSLKLREEINNRKGIAESLNNIGHIYDNQALSLHKNNVQQKKLFKKALEYYIRSLKIRTEINDRIGCSQTLNNIGYIYFNEGNIKDALNYYNQSLKFSEEINHKLMVSNTLSHMANIMLTSGKLSEAYTYATRCMTLAKELGYPDQINRAAKALRSIYMKQNKYKDALEMYELEIQMRDSINNTETKKASIKKQFQYQYEKKAAADSVKNAEEQKVKNAQLMAQQAQLKQEKTQRIALYGGLLLVIAFSVFVYNRFKITQKQKKIIEEQKQEVDSAYLKLHEKNKEVMDSIRYAARIQKSLIPTEKYISSQLRRLRGK